MYIELAEDLLPVPLHRVLREHQPPRDLAIGHITGGKLQYVDFTMGKPAKLRTPGRLICTLDPGLLRREAAQQLLRIVQLRRVEMMPGDQPLQQTADFPAGVDERAHEVMRCRYANCLAYVLPGGTHVIAEEVQRRELE